MSFNYIIITGVEEAELELALGKLVEEYTNYEKFGPLHFLEIDSSTNIYAVRFENEPDFQRFAYVVNFLKYPIGADYKNADIKGFYSLKEELHISGIGKERLMLYIPNEDKDYFNVSVVSEFNKSFMFDWNSKDEMFKEVKSKIGFSEADFGISKKRTLRFYNFRDNRKTKQGCLGVLFAILLIAGIMIKNML